MTMEANQSPQRQSVRASIVSRSKQFRVNVFDTAGFYAALAVGAWSGIREEVSDSSRRSREANEDEVMAPQRLTPPVAVRATSAKSTDVNNDRSLKDVTSFIQQWAGKLGSVLGGVAVIGAALALSLWQSLLQKIQTKPSTPAVEARKPEVHGAAARVRAGRASSVPVAPTVATLAGPVRAEQQPVNILRMGSKWIDQNKPFVVVGAVFVAAVAFPFLMPLGNNAPQSPAASEQQQLASQSFVTQDNTGIPRDITVPFGPDSIVTDDTTLPVCETVKANENVWVEAGVQGDNAVELHQYGQTKIIKFTDDLPEKAGGNVAVKSDLEGLSPEVKALAEESIADVYGIRPLEKRFLQELDCN